MAAIVAQGQGVIAINTTVPNGYVKYSNTVAGVWAVGNAYVAGLYYAADQATLLSGGGTLAANGGTNGTGLAIFTGGTGGYVAASTFGGNRTIPAGNTWFQLRAWSAGYATYADAVASGSQSVFVTPTSGPGAPPVATGNPVEPPTPVANILWAAGSTSANPFVASLVPVPEPSTIAMVGLGLLGLLFIRRRK